MEKQYNYIYSKLVNGENDIVGHISYSLYKKQKQELIKKHEEKTGEPITDEQICVFHSTSALDETIKSYRLRAENILVDFINEMDNTRLEEAEKELKRTYDDRLKEIVKDMKPSFWAQVLVSVFAAFVFALLGAAFGFIKIYG